MMGFMFLLLLLVAGLLGLLGGLHYFGIVPRRDPLPGDARTREGLHRLAESLGAIEARLDRLEDQQRFLERLLESRPERPALPAPEEPAGGEEPERGVDSVLFDVEREES